MKNELNKKDTEIIDRIKAGAPPSEAEKDYFLHQTLEKLFLLGLSLEDITEAAICVSDRLDKKP